MLDPFELLSFMYHVLGEYKCCSCLRLEGSHYFSFLSILPLLLVQEVSAASFHALIQI